MNGYISPRLDERLATKHNENWGNLGNTPKIRNHNDNADVVKKKKPIIEKHFI